MSLRKTYNPCARRITHKNCKLNSEVVFIKIGSSHINESREWFDSFLEAIDALNISVVLVVSGAVRTGRQYFNCSVKPQTHSAEYKHCAKIGQSILTDNYRKGFKKLGRSIEEILLTRDDFRGYRKYMLNKKFTRLLQQGRIPLVNADEFGEGVNYDNGFPTNDELVADLALLLKTFGHNILEVVNLTDQNGLYTENPLVKPDAKLIRILRGVPYWALDCAKGACDDSSNGGFRTKLEAAKGLSASGVICRIMSRNDFISACTNKIPHHTLILPLQQRKGTSCYPCII